jgi:hypothetical protein
MDVVVLVDEREKRLKAGRLLRGRVGRAWLVDQGCCCAPLAPVQHRRRSRRARRRLVADWWRYDSGVIGSEDAVEERLQDTNTNEQ